MDNFIVFSRHHLQDLWQRYRNYHTCASLQAPYSNFERWQLCMMSLWREHPPFALPRLNARQSLACLLLRNLSSKNQALLLFPSIDLPRAPSREFLRASKAALSLSKIYRQHRFRIICVPPDPDILRCGLPSFLYPLQHLVS